MSGIMISTFNGNGTGGGGGGSTTYSVTVGNTSSDYGFISGTIGSISPVTLSGVNINNLYVYVGGTNRLYITLAGSVAQGVFTNLVVGGISYTSLSATYGFVGGATIWTWSITTNPFATIGSVVPVTIT